MGIPLRDVADLSLRVRSRAGGWEYDVQSSGPPKMRSTGFCASSQSATGQAIAELRSLAGIPEPGDPRLGGDGREPGMAMDPA